MESKTKRHRALQAARQGLVLSAARQVVQRKGVAQASLREIAREAGYTPGALYSFFPDKQALLLALVHEVLDQLSAAVSAARAAKAGAEELLLARLSAWLQYLQGHPQDRDLLLHFTRMPDARLPADPSRRALLEGLRQTLAPVAETLQAAGLDEEHAQLGRDALMAQALGWLMLQQGQEAAGPGSVREAGLQQMRLLVRGLLPAAQAGAPAVAVPVAGLVHPAQVDLFG